MSASHGSQHTVSRVSSSAGQPADVNRHEVVSIRTQRNNTGPSQYVSHGHSYPTQCAASVTPTLMSYGQTGFGAPASLVPDPTDEDFSAYITYDQEEHTGSMGALRSDKKLCFAIVRETNCAGSFTHGFGVQSTVTSGVPADVKPLVSIPPQDLKCVSQGSSVATSLASESDEGRHRNHPLYNEGPKADGLYHCPYKAKDPTCPHKPTKLKCNYEYDLPSTPCSCVCH
jgi:hypothetical protein